jgi:calcineurin-like phosphoesterase family protein
MTWDKKRYGSYMLHGHEHFSLGNITDRFMLDVGVDNPICEYGPINMDMIHYEMSKKTNVPVGHH